MKLLMSHDQINFRSNPNFVSGFTDQYPYREEGIFFDGGNLMCQMSGSREISCFAKTARIRLKLVFFEVPKLVFNQLKVSKSVKKFAV